MRSLMGKFDHTPIIALPMSTSTFGWNAKPATFTPRYM